MEISVLGPGLPPVLEAVPFSSVFTDLNLDRTINELTLKAKGYRIASMFSFYPENADAVHYRQEIYEDIVYELKTECVQEFSKAMRTTRELVEKWQTTPNEHQRRVCYLSAVSEYVLAVKKFYEALKTHNLKSQGLQKLCGYLHDMCENEKFVACCTESENLKNELTDISFHISVCGDEFSVATGKETEYYFDKLRKLFPDRFQKQEEGRAPEEYYIQNPFIGDYRLSYLETEAIRVYKKLKPAFFAAATQYEQKYADIINADLYVTEEELQFYLAFHKLRTEMEKYGYRFCMPTITTDGSFCAENVYDLALAWKNIWERRVTVSNNVSYRPGEKFFVVTGPNQGGKTTFARSVGQLVFFAMQGLPVPAESARIPFFSGILTHFSVEESMETGRGKLKEELARLRPMMKDNAQNRFVIINELFTTAATYDATIMGNRVLDYFMQNNCTGVYVTHIAELATEKDGIVSLVAVTDGQNHKHRTFKVERRPAGGIGYAADIVDRHHLTYRDLTYRLDTRLNELELMEADRKTRLLNPEEEPVEELQDKSDGEEEEKKSETGETKNETADEVSDKQAAAENAEDL